MQQSIARFATEIDGRAMVVNYAQELRRRITRTTAVSVVAQQMVEVEVLRLLLLMRGERVKTVKVIRFNDKDKIINGRPVHH